MVERRLATLGDSTSISNTNDAIAFAQTVEGGLDEITNMLQRVRTLAVQANNGINTAEDKDAINKEAIQLTQEITRIASQTTYGGKNILAGEVANSIYSETSTVVIGQSANSGTISFQIGANSGDSITFGVNDFTFSKFADRAVNTANGGTLGTALGGANSTDGFTNDPAVTAGNVGSLQFDLKNNADNAIASIDAMIKDIDGQRAKLGSLQNRLESSIRVQSNVITNKSDARSRIRDTDFAEESANLSQQSIIQQAATSMLMQANARPQLGLSLLG